MTIPKSFSPVKNACRHYPDFCPRNAIEGSDLCDVHHVNAQLIAAPEPYAPPQQLHIKTLPNFELDDLLFGEPLDPDPLMVIRNLKAFKATKLSRSGDPNTFARTEQHTVGIEEFRIEPGSYATAVLQVYRPFRGQRLYLESNRPDERTVVMSLQSARQNTITGPIPVNYYTEANLNSEGKTDEHHDGRKGRPCCFHAITPAESIRIELFNGGVAPVRISGCIDGLQVTR